jgi:hypothetical protein
MRDFLKTQEKGKKEKVEDDADVSVDPVWSQIMLRS